MRKLVFERNIVRETIAFICSHPFSVLSVASGLVLIKLIGGYIDISELWLSTLLCWYLSFVVYAKILIPNADPEHLFSKVQGFMLWSFFLLIVFIPATLGGPSVFQVLFGLSEPASNAANGVLLSILSVSFATVLPAHMVGDKTGLWSSIRRGWRQFGFIISRSLLLIIAIGIPAVVLVLVAVLIGSLIMALWFSMDQEQLTGISSQMGALTGQVLFVLFAIGGAIIGSRAYMRDTEFTPEASSGFRRSGTNFRVEKPTNTLQPPKYNSPRSQFGRR